MAGAVIFLLVFLIVIGFILYVNYSNNEKIDLIGKELIKIPEFSITNSLISAEKGIVFDQKNEKIGIALKFNKEIKTYVVDCNKLTGVEIELLEGKSTTKKRLFSDISTERSYESIVLCITFSDFEISSFRISLYNSPDKPDALSKMKERQCIETANVWRSQLMSIIRNNQLPIKIESGAKMTAEIEKLYELFQNGILSEDEFKFAKAKIFQ